MLVRCLFIAIAFTGVLTHPALASPLTQRIELALRCKAEPLDAHNPATRQWLQQHGVHIIDHDPEGTPDFEYHLKRPITVAGVQVKKLYYQADSGGIFHTEFSGDAKALSRRLQLHVNKRNAQGQFEDGAGRFVARYTNHQAGPGAQLQVVGPLLSQPQRSGWGCRFYDG